MRIVGGHHKGRPLSAPKGRDTRPTSDRAREAMFNVLEHLPHGPGLSGARIIDVFAGTGALGLEALSRGAAHATFVEHHRDAIAAINANIDVLNQTAHTTVLPVKAAAIPTPPSPHAGPVDYAFLDAPYDKGLTVPALRTLAERGWLSPGVVIMAEIAAGEDFTPPDGFDVVKEKKYGAARVAFLVLHPSPE